MYYHVLLLNFVRTQFGSLSKQFLELSEKFKFSGILESWSKCSTGRRHDNFKHLSQIGFRMRPVCNVHCSILQYSWHLIMDMLIVNIEGHEAQQLTNYDMPMVFSDNNGSAQKKCSRVLDSCWEYLTEQAYPNMLIQAKCMSCNTMVKHH